MKIIKILLLAGLAGLAGCDKELNTPTRSFYMGFTPLPYALSAEAVSFTYGKIATSSDIINHHFDNGVPWIEALQDTAFHPNIMSDWTFRKENTPAGHRVYLSVAALSPERNGLAKYRSSDMDQPLPPPWNSYGFNSEEVKVSYTNYCKRIIRFFQPDYFNMNVEANLLYFIDPGQWSDFLMFHRHVYEALKNEFPDLLIFSSVTGAHMLEGFYHGSDHIKQRLAVLQVLEYSDLYALSFYPYLSAFLGDPYPDNVFETLFNISPKPVAIAETGYPAQIFSVNTGTSIQTITGDEVKQNNFIEMLLKASEKHRARFVINFVLRDYDELWASLGARDDLIIAWRDTGLLKESGEERPAYATWKSYFNKELQPAD